MEAERKAVLKLKPAFNLWIVLVDMSKARLEPRDRKLVPIRPEKFTIGSYPLEGFPISPIHPVIPVNSFMYCSSTCHHIHLSQKIEIENMQKMLLY